MVNIGMIIAAIICFIITIGILAISSELGEEKIAIGTASSSGFGFSLISATAIAIIGAIGFGLFGFILLIFGLISSGGKKEIIKEVVHIPTPLPFQPIKVKEGEIKKSEIRNFCIECGNKLKPIDKFCSKCGTRVK
jgi:hypothetical protein